MFRMGGSTENSGIMDGMRQRYSNSDPEGVQPMTAQEAVAELDIPSGDVIAKMDWSDINALVERLEGQI